MVATTGFALTRLRTSENSAVLTDVPSISVAPATTSAPQPTVDDTTPTTTTTRPPADSLAPELQTLIDQLRTAADRLAIAGKLELADQVRGYTGSLEQKFQAGEVKTITAQALVDLLNAMVSTASKPQFGPEGEWACEPPLIPDDIALSGWCYLFPDEARGIADVIAVGPTRAMVVRTGSPRSPELDAAMDEGLGMILADPSSAPRAVALVGSVRARISGAYPRPNRVVATFDPPIDIGSTTLSTHRKGDGYVLVVGERTIDIP